MNESSELFIHGLMPFRIFEGSGKIGGLNSDSKKNGDVST